MITAKLKSYNDIQTEYPNRRIPYATLLTASEWEDKRNIIISRDNNTCQICKERCIDAFRPALLANGKVIFVPSRVEESDSGHLDLIVQKYPHFAQVHHTYYIANKPPWDYIEDSLQLLCHICHSKLHKENLIPVYDDERLIDKKLLTPCNRCNGAGHFPQYTHIDNGDCFKCKGACFEEWIE